jgi:hypothetical protein
VFLVQECPNSHRNFDLRLPLGDDARGTRVETNVLAGQRRKIPIKFMH